MQHALVQRHAREAPKHTDSPAQAWELSPQDCSAASPSLHAYAQGHSTYLSCVDRPGVPISQALLALSPTSLLVCWGIALCPIVPSLKLSVPVWPASQQILLLHLVRQILSPDCLSLTLVKKKHSILDSFKLKDSNSIEMQLQNWRSFCLCSSLLSPNYLAAEYTEILIYLNFIVVCLIRKVSGWLVVYLHVLGQSYQGAGGKGGSHYTRVNTL